MKYRWQYAFMCLGYASVVAVSIFVPKLLSDMIAGIGTMDKEEFVGLVVPFLLLVLLEFFGEFVFGHYNYKLSNRALIDAENDAVSCLINTRYENLVQQNASYMVQLVHNDLVMLMDFFVEKIPSLVFQLVEILILVWIILSTNLYIGIAAVLCVAFYVLLYFLSKKKYYVLQKEASEVRNGFLSFVIGKMTRVLQIKLNSWQAVVKKSFRKKVICM